MRVLAIGAQKGGCGKTTSSLYLATRAAERLGGTRDNPAVALIDRDESKNLSILLREYPELVRPGVVFLAGEDLPPESTGIPLIIIDTPPGLSAIKSLREAHYILVPVLPELQGVLNLTRYLQNIEAQRLAVSPSMRLLALLPARVQPRALSDRQRLADIAAIAAQQRPPLVVLSPVPQREAIKRYDLDTPEYDAPARELFHHAKIDRPASAL
jgi:cellulose biosynthesis protein BcsQ